MNTSRLLIGFLLLMLAGACYKDKGNYDYKEVNDFKVVLTPAPADDEYSIYLVNQPGVEADTFRLSAEGSQTLNGSADNLEYSWYRTLSVEGEDETRDTVYGKENVMPLAASKKSEWQVLLVVRDKSMNLEYYKSLTVKTKVPFYNSWLFVHGDAGARKLGALSWDANGNAEVIPDIMEAMGQPGYPHMTSIAYTNNGAEDYLASERLFIISSPDSASYVFPFDCKMMASYRQMGIPGNVRIREMVTTKIEAQPYVALISNEGKLYYSSKWGAPMFQPATGNVASDYQADLAYINKDGYVTMWDNSAKRLIYYVNGSLGYMGTLGADDLTDKKALWLGRDAKTVNTEQEPTLFIAKNENNDKCYLYRIDYNQKGDKMTKDSDGKDNGKDDGKEEYAYGNVTCDSTFAWGFTEKTLFAVSDYYQDQFFFTEGNTVYRGIMADGEKVKLYATEGTIKKMAFRLTNDCSNDKYDVNMRILAMVVSNAEGQDEIHEIHLGNSGDVEEKHVYKLGNVSIVDWGFTGVNREMER